MSHDSWHFYCIQWENTDGLLQTYQDAVLLYTRNRAMGYDIPSGGTLVLGQELNAPASGFDSTSVFWGSLSGLNFWTFFLSKDEIQGMAAGLLNINGNLVQWRDFRNLVFGHVSVVNRSEAEIPGMFEVS